MSTLRPPWKNFCGRPCAGAYIYLKRCQGTIFGHLLHNVKTSTSRALPHFDIRAKTLSVA